jgi:hypothetical protein
MDDRLKDILESLPPKPPRSRMDPYRELIDELRRVGRTYREISAILAEKCELRVTASAVHDFVRRRRKNDRRAEWSEWKLPTANRPTSGKTARRGAFDKSIVEQRIAVLKRKGAEPKPLPARFAFDGDEPLRLMQSDEKLCEES